LVTFLLAIGILTFGMMGARLVKLFEFLSRGVPLLSAVQFLFYISPLVLTLSIPWAALVAIMLVFGRMSADNEITAMRACGISILQIISPIILIVFLLTCFCVYLQLDVAPEWTYRARGMITQVGVDQPLSIFEAGRPVEFENNHILIDERVGETGLKNIQVWRMGKGKKVEQDISAASGKIDVDKNAQILNVVLDDAKIVSYDSKNNDKPTRTFSKQMIFSIDYGKKFNSIKIGKEIKYLSFREIFGRAVLDKRRGIDTTKIEVELNQRIALALSPIAFMLLGLPLAIRTSRKETSVGLFLSVILAGVYFSLVMVFEAFNDYPQYYPQALLWIPNVSYQVFGLVFIFKIAQK
jgi:lipopolysaccharide export LptBFGC system permease protein LptF